MILHLYQEKYQDDVLMALTEAGIEETIVLSGESLVHKLAFDMPLFAGFRKSYGSGKGFASVIMAIAAKEQVEFMLEELKNSGIEFIENKLGSIVLLPVENIYK
jgi:hypothetical protein